MPDNSVAIAEIETILRAGAERVVIDGQAVTYDFDELRAQRQALKLNDDATLAAAKARPRTFRTIFSPTNDRNR